MTTYWFVDETGLFRYGNDVPATALSWGRIDERGVYHYATEASAQDLVDRHPSWNLKRAGTTVRM